MQNISRTRLIMRKKNRFCRAGLKTKPADKNGATHLIRHALGGTDYGIEHSKLSHMLSLPPDVVRLFRDDMTATVIYFNQNFVRNARP